MIDRSNYNGITEAWKVSLLIRRAKRFGFRRHNLEDAVQEIILDVIQFKYVPEKSNGASEMTALTAMIDNRLMAMLRSSTRYQAYLEKYQKTVEGEYDPDAKNMNVADVRTVVSALPTDQQAICHALAAGNTKHQVAQALGYGWHRVARAVQAIRSRFEERGFGKGCN